MYSLHSDSNNCYSFLRFVKVLRLFQVVLWLGFLAKNPLKSRGSSFDVRWIFQDDSCISFGCTQCTRDTLEVNCHYYRWKTFSISAPIGWSSWLNNLLLSCFSTFKCLAFFDPSNVYLNPSFFLSRIEVRGTLQLVHCCAADPL